MKLRLEDRLVDGRTVLGYHTFSDSNLQKLFGTNYKPLDRDSELLRMRREVILANHIDNDIDLESDTFDMAKWETFPKEEFPIYDHGCRTLKKFIEKAAAEFSDDLIEKLEAYYTHPNLDGEILPYSRIIMYDGWVRYPYQSEEVQPGVPPQGDVFVLDTETFVRGFPTKHSDPNATNYKEGIYRFDAPVIATAADNEANYVWMHKNLINGNHEDEWFVSLVPLEERDCIVLAFNSGFDIAKIENTYSLEETKIKWMDLMSCHTARRGYSDDQMKEAGAIRAKTGKGGYLPRWVTEGSKSNLKDSYNLYCGQTYGFLKDEDKKIRNFFVDMGSIAELMENWEQMITYSVNDATYTFRQSKRVLPDYLDAHGLNSSVAVHPIIADSRFHINGEEWEEFIEHSEDLYHDMMKEQQDIFDRIADGIYEDYSEGYLTQEEIDVDPWLKNLDWESKGKIKTTKTKYYTAIDINKNIVFDDIELPKNTLVRDLTSQWQLEHPYIHKLKYKFTDIVQYESEGYGIPRWYYPRIKDGTLGVTVRGRLCHYLLRLKYLGKPIEFVQGEAWQNTDGIKPVHKKGVGVNVGYILTQDQVKYYENGDWTSAGQDKYLARLFEISSSTSFYISTRKRILSAYHRNNVMSGGYIVVQTVTSRSGSKLWSVAPNPTTKKVGSDLKNFVRSRPGYKLVSGDYDSQEGFIFSILGDSRTGLFNSNPYSHSCSTGSKDYDPPTDFHSVVARSANISRNAAKVCNFGAMFGSGKKGLTNSLLSANREDGFAMAEQRATSFLNSVKGKMVTYDKKNYRYKGGKASDCYNVMLARGDAHIQEFPLTSQEYPVTLQHRHTKKDFILTRSNLQVQGTGKHLLEILILLTYYWCKEFGVYVRYVISIHDAFVMETKEEDTEKLSAILQMSHLFSYAILREQLGIKEIGLSGAFLSLIEEGDYFMKSIESSTETLFNNGEYPEGNKKAWKIEELLPMIQEIFG